MMISQSGQRISLFCEIFYINLQIIKLLFTERIYILHSNFLLFLEALKRKNLSKLIKSLRMELEQNQLILLWPEIVSIPTEKPTRKKKAERYVERNY